MIKLMLYLMEEDLVPDELLDKHIFAQNVKRFENDAEGKKKEREYLLYLIEAKDFFDILKEQNILAKNEDQSINKGVKSLS